MTCVVTAYHAPNWPIDTGEPARLFDSKESINGSILGPQRTEKQHSICCRAVLSLIGSQFDARTTTLSVALFVATSLFRKVWSIEALDWSSRMIPPGGPISNDGTRGTVLNLTGWTGKVMDRLTEDLYKPCCSLIDAA